MIRVVPAGTVRGSQVYAPWLVTSNKPWMDLTRFNPERALNAGYQRFDLMCRMAAQELEELGWVRPLPEPDPISDSPTWEECEWYNGE